MMTEQAHSVPMAVEWSPEASWDEYQVRRKAIHHLMSELSPLSNDEIDATRHQVAEFGALSEIETMAVRAIRLAREQEKGAKT